MFLKTYRVYLMGPLCLMFAGQPAKAQTDSLFLSVDQHFEHGVVVRIVSHFFQVIMLSAYTQTFLRVRDSVVFGRVVTQNNIFKLVHPCVGKHQGRVIFYHHRSRGNNVVSFRLKEILE